jgi:hypothetical protein
MSFSPGDAGTVYKKKQTDAKNDNNRANKRDKLLSVLADKSVMAD